MLPARTIRACDESARQEESCACGGGRGPLPPVQNVERNRRGDGKENDSRRETCPFWTPSGGVINRLEFSGRKYVDTWRT